MEAEELSSACEEAINWKSQSVVTTPEPNEVIEVKFLRLDPSVWKLMTERQQKKYRKHGVLPKWVKLTDKQLRYKPVDRPRTGSRGTNPIDNLWDDVRFAQLSEE